MALVALYICVLKALLKLVLLLAVAHTMLMGGLCWDVPFVFPWAEPMFRVEVKIIVYFRAA